MRAMTEKECWNKLYAWTYNGQIRVEWADGSYWEGRPF